MTGQLPVLVIAGPTASGKSALAAAAATRLDGEIVSADAAAVYRLLDIGTDKPSPELRRRIPHHLVDVAEPGERFSAGAFAEAADRAIAAISARRKTPVVAGGSHFYLRALLLGLFPAPSRRPALTAELDHQWQQDAGALWHRLHRADPAAAERIGRADRQRIIRALEVFEQTGEPLSRHWQRHPQRPRYRPLMVAPHRRRDELYVRINERVDMMFVSGLVEEVRRILDSGVPHDTHALKAIGYRQVVAVLRGECELEEAIAGTKRASRRLAKRQLTWLRHLDEGSLHWVAPVENGGADEVVALWDRHMKGSGIT